MKLKKCFAITLAGIMAAATLTGCSSPTSSQSVQNAVSGSQSASTPSAEKVKVNIWSATFAASQDYVNAFTAAFNASEYADGIEVSFAEIPAGTNQEKADALLTNLIGDGDIDIFDANLSEYFNFASKGMFQNLEDYAAADKFNFDQLGKDNVELSRINGDLYALPYIQSVWLLYYNKDIFDKEKVAYPTDDMTWNDFRELAKKLTKGEGSEKQWGFTMPDWTCTWAGMATQEGLGFIKEDGTVNTDNEAFRNALQFKYDLTMVDKTGPSLAENTVTKAHYAKQFSAGNIAMMVAGDWVHGTIKQNLEGNYTFKYDVTAMPHPEGVQAGTTYGAPRYTGINAKRSDEQKQAAWQVLKFMASEEVAKILVDTATLPAVVTDEAVAAYEAMLPEFVENGAVIFKEHKHVEEKPYHVASAQIDKVMTEEAQLFLTDSQSLDETMKKIVERSNEEAKRAEAAIAG